MSRSRRAPRHKAPRSLRRSVGRAATSVNRALPGSAYTRSAVVVGVASLAVGIGALTAAQTPTMPAAQGSAAHAAANDAGHSAGLSLEAREVLAQHEAQAQAGAQTRRFNRASRSATRTVPPAFTVDKAAELAAAGQAVGGAVTQTIAPATPREIAMSLLSAYGWDSGQFSCLDAIWSRESGWNPYAWNHSSGAYGIPQALPGSKMASYGSDWMTNPVTQIKWGLAYIRGSYGSPCAAWGFWQYHHYY